jgi:hypothetical protein
LLLTLLGRKLQGHRPLRQASSDAAAQFRIVSVEGELASNRVSAVVKTSSGTTTTTTDTSVPDGRGPLNGEYTEAKKFNLSEWFNDPHTTAKGEPWADFDYVGTKQHGKTVFSLSGDSDPTLAGEQNVFNQIWNGTMLAGAADGTITFGFWEFRNKLGPNSNGEHKGYTPFTEAQKALARESILSWDEVIAVDFKEVAVSSHDASQWAKGDAPDILMANTTTGPAQAWAYLPTSKTNGGWARSAGDVWIGADPSNRVNVWDGGYGETTQIHELGHSIGLSHPGNYDFGDDNDGDGVPDPITYEGDAFYFQDTLQYSIMSYFDAYESGSNWVDWSIMRFQYSSTPMVHDIWVAQKVYGVETTTRPGNDTYGFNWTSGVTNTAMQFKNTYEQATIFTIWDANGTDTIDLSGYHTPSVIDLREGAYSSAGGWNAYGNAPAASPTDMTPKAYLDYVNANNALLGMPARSATLVNRYLNGDELVENVSFLDMVGRDLLMENNIGIAYGAVIENAKGGHGNDRINGNQATNQFTGNGGADTFIIADHSGVIDRPDGKVTITDTSVDSIMDFNRGQGDKIDVSELGVTAYNQLSFDNATDTVTVLATNEQFKILGASDIQAGDFIFG